MTSEARIQSEIRLALGLEPDLLLFRNANVKASFYDPASGGEKFVSAGLGDGSADLVGVLRVATVSHRSDPLWPGTGQIMATTGRFFALEVKQPGKKPRADQVRWAELVQRFGGFCCAVTGVDEARAALARARRGECK